MKNKRLSKPSKILPISGKLKKPLSGEKSISSDADALSEKIPVEKISEFTKEYLNQIETIRIKMILHTIESNGFDGVVPASEQDVEFIQWLRTMDTEQFKAFRDLFR